MRDLGQWTDAANAQDRSRSGPGRRGRGLRAAGGALDRSLGGVVSNALTAARPSVLLLYEQRRRRRFAPGAPSNGAAPPSPPPPYGEEAESRAVGVQGLRSRSKDAG